MRNQGRIPGVGVTAAAVTAEAALRAAGDAALVGVEDVTGASYTLVLADAGKLKRFDRATAQTVTVPPNSSVAYPVGTFIELAQVNAGALTVAAGAGVTINTPTTLGFGTQWQHATLVKTATDRWLLCPSQSGTSVVTSGTASARPAAAAAPNAWYYATDTGQLSHSDGSTWTNVAPASGNTATIGELFVDAWVTSGVGALLSTVNAASVPVMTAPVPMTIKQVAFTSWTTSITQSDTDYWTATLRRYRAGVAADIAVKTTKTTGGASWNNRTPWTFDSITLDATNSVFQQYDIFGVFLQKTGAPADPAGVRCTVRWEPA